MSGNCAMGIAKMAMTPASVMTIAMTMASRGRSMKSRTASGPRYDGCGHDLAGTDLLNALDDDLLSLFEAVGHHDVAPLLGTGRYAALLDLLGRVDHEHIAAGLIEQDGACGTVSACFGA